MHYKITRVVYVSMVAFLIAALSVVGISSGSLHAQAFDLTLSSPVGGKFLPGLVDIFTPDPLCGLLVTVEQPNGIPNIMTFAPINVYNYFDITPEHVFDNTIGMSFPNPDITCPPIYYMFGSSLTP